MGSGHLSQTDRLNVKKKKKIPKHINIFYIFVSWNIQKTV